MQHTQKYGLKKRQAGFSFVELAVVLLAVGMVAAMSLSAGMTQMKMLEVTSTQAKLGKIRDALHAFREKYGRYPCPVENFVEKDWTDYASIWDWFAAYGTPASYKIPDNFGAEAKSCAEHTAIVQTGNVEFGVSSYAGIAVDKTAFIGSVPYRELGLSPDVTIDGWGNRITYVIDVVHTVKSSIGPGMIDVVDASGSSLVQSPTQGKAIFALISHGADGSGAYPENSVVRNACPTTTKDAENCDDDDVILDDSVKDSTSNASHNDDYVLWYAQANNTKNAIRKLPKVQSVVAGGYTTCVIKENGSLWCMGSNSDGNLGSKKSTAYLVVPTQVEGGGEWKKISKSDSNGCGIKKNDTLWCWGSNSYGEVGDGTTVNKTTPVLVSGGGTWKDVSSGAFHTCAIKSDDTLWCWGYNNAGQIGDGTSIKRTTPRQIVSGTTWKMIDAGFSHACAIKSDDTLWCWGYNVYGQLGAGNTLNRNVPTQISGGGLWKQVSTAESQGCGIKLDDSLWCWGTGNQLGNGTGAASYTPTLVSGGGTWLQVAAGSAHTCGIKSDNSLWCWGDDGDMELGDMNNASQQLVPVVVYGQAQWKQVSLGVSHTCAIRLDDTSWCWGNNWFGQLGYGFQYSNGTSSGLVPVFGIPAPVIFP